MKEKISDFAGLLKGKTLKEKIAVLFSIASVRYICSSLFAFVIEYVLMLVLSALFADVGFLADREFLGGMASYYVGMTLAWMVSSVVNFSVNRSLVFRSKEPILPAFLKYFALATPVFIVKGFGLVTAIMNLLHLPVAIAYPLAQMAMFVITYVIQKKLIFKMKKTKIKEDFDDADA